MLSAVADEFDIDRKLDESERGPAAYPTTDGEPDEDYGAYSRALWDEQEGSLDQLHQVWIQNILFLAGYQWWRFDSLRGMWGPERAPEWKEHPVANLCLPFFKHFLSKVTKNKPAWTAIAASSDPEDVQAAQTGEDALTAKWVELRMARVLRRAVGWVIPTGNAFLLPYWNTRTGKLIPLTAPVEAAEYDEATGQPTGRMVEVECPCDENGEPKMKAGPGGVQVYDMDAEPAYVDEGEIGCRVYSPFQVRVDPSAECDEDVTWVLIGEVALLRDVKRENPDVAHLINAEDVGIIDQYDRMVSGILAGPDTQSVSGAASRDEEIPKTLKLHYYEKQTPKYPKGRYWCTCGSVVLGEPGPLPDELWPVLVHLTDVEVPGRYHAMATMEAIVGLNREYNEINGMVKEHHNLLLRGKWLVPIGSNIRKGQITTQPGEVIQHTPGLAPVQADMKPLPPAVYQERERVLRDFQQISGIHDVSMGKAPTGVTSGTAFLTLQEADDSDLGPFLAMLEESVAELAWKFLQLMQRNYDDERLMYVVGENRRYMVKSFKGADLTGVIDVVPQTGSAFPWSQTARQSMLLDLVGKLPNLFLNEEGQFDKAEFARRLPHAGLESLSQTEDIDINEALREEEDFSMFSGEPGSVVPQITPWQNVAVHLRTHTRRLKSAEFEKWPIPAQQAFIAHWGETQARVMAMQAEAQMRAAVLSGQVPDPAAGGEDDPSSSTE